MAVHLTRIYTKTGDDGTTGLGDMSRTSKKSTRITAFADVDETNAAIGVVLALGKLDAQVVEVLRRVQNELFDVGADLCTPVTPAPAFAPLRVTDAYVERLERDCDDFNSRLAPLNSFILPGGSVAAALLHVARTVARRAERSTWGLIQDEPDATSRTPALYLNRLSDLLFILCRITNDDGRRDVLWEPGRTP
ncbi:MAG: cob(I)yrinic acid a,c-diamide adenosyltransferase [Mycobacteriales bacterium]|nr:cob(I)yrinic acid a,c-diamide adenosyltransferase [Frankia sp.]